MTHEVSTATFRTMILCDWKIGFNYRERHARLVAAWGRQAPSGRRVLNWFHEHERGKFDVSDLPGPRRPRTAVTDEMIPAVQLMVDEDPYVTYQQIENTLGVHSPAIFSILHDHLQSQKVGRRWVPHQLTNDQKRSRFSLYPESLKQFNRGCS